ncbi:MAG: hypothetical protein WEB88_03625 [Gemmatimonadota bacterium]
MRLRHLLAVVVSALALLALGWLSRAPYTPSGADQGLLRLSWRHVGQPAEVCRQRTQQELDALPVHMRTPQDCQRRRTEYTLVLRVNGGAPDSALVLPEGARGDRPVYVLRERALPPGEHQVEIHFAPAVGEGDTLTFAGPVRARPGAIELITTAPDGGTLVHLSGARGQAP